jgi:hypothetical protein
VRNPNGDFNVNSGGSQHYFDYAPDAFVNLTAGNMVQLGATTAALPRADNLPSYKVDTTVTACPGNQIGEAMALAGDAAEAVDAQRVLVSLNALPPSTVRTAAAPE